MGLAIVNLTNYVIRFTFQERQVFRRVLKGDMTTNEKLLPSDLALTLNKSQLKRNVFKLQN